MKEQKLHAVAPKTDNKNKPKREKVRVKKKISDKTENSCYTHDVTPTEQQ